MRPAKSMYARRTKTSFEARPSDFSHGATPVPFEAEPAAAPKRFTPANTGKPAVATEPPRKLRLVQLIDAPCLLSRGNGTEIYMGRRHLSAGRPSGAEKLLISYGPSASFCVVLPPKRPPPNVSPETRSAVFAGISSVTDSDFIPVLTT